MKPILFESNASTWTTKGIAVLTDAVSCKVTEQRNGSYELEMTYPVNGSAFSDIALRRLIVAKPNFTDNPQPFRIYKISKPINGIVSIYAQHISYDMSGIPVAPFTTNKINLACGLLTSNAMVTCPFNLTTTRATEAPFAVDVPSSLRSWLGGKEGSLLNVYGGEWHFDGFNASIENNRGANRGFTIRYGKNLTDLTQEENCDAVYTGVIAYWKGQDGTVVYSAIQNVTGTFNYTRVYSLDVTDQYESAPTTAQLNTKAANYITANNVGVPKVNLTLDFVQLSTLEDRVDLCDTVNIYFEQLGVNATAKCITTVWDVLLDRYSECEFGDAVYSIADTITSIEAAAEDAASSAADARQHIYDINQHFMYNNTGAYVTVQPTDGETTPEYSYTRMHSGGFEVVNEDGVKVAEFKGDGAAFGYDQTVFAEFGKEVTIGSRRSGSSEGDYSVVIGYDCEATGAYGFARGMRTIASNQGSSAEGLLTHASQDYQRAFGVANADENGAEVVGSGTLALSSPTKTGDGITKVFEYTITAEQETNGFFVKVSTPSNIPYTTAYDSVNKKYIVTFAEAPPSESAIYAQIYTAQSRSNIRVLKWNGNEYLAGDIFVNGDTTTGLGAGRFSWFDGSSYSTVVALCEAMALKTRSFYLKQGWAAQLLSDCPTASFTGNAKLTVISGTVTGTNAPNYMTLLYEVTNGTKHEIWRGAIYGTSPKNVAWFKLSTSYKSGETVNIGANVYAGYFDSSKNLYFFIPLNKDLSDVSSASISTDTSWAIYCGGSVLLSNTTLASFGTITCTLGKNGVLVKVAPTSTTGITARETVSVRVNTATLKLT